MGLSIISIPVMVSQVFAALAVVLGWKRGFGGEGQHRKPLLAKAHGDVPQGGNGKGLVSAGWFDGKDSALPGVSHPKKIPSVLSIKGRILPCPPDLHQERLREAGEVTGAKPSLPVCGGVKWSWMRHLVEKHPL